MQPSLPVLVSLTGFCVSGIGLLGLLAPAVLTRLLARFRVVIGLPVTLSLRIVFGSLFLLAAADCRLPALVRLVGFLELAGAAGLLVVGAGRLERFGAWWLARPHDFHRKWCLAAFGVGAVIAYAGA